MNPEPTPLASPTRREFIKTTGTLAAASALAGIALPHVHAAGSDLVRVALVGCGGRGTGAAENAISTSSGPIKLVAMADVFPEKLNSSHDALKRQFSDKVEVPKDQMFLGFDAYKHAIDSLKKDDVVILTTPCAFRWVQFSYAVEKGVNVFMEKPLAPDAPSARRMFKLGEESVKKDMKVGVGLMVRHCKARQALLERIRAGEIGDITMMRAYRMAGPMVGFAPPNPGGMSDLMYQIQKFHSFIWASGGTFSDFYIHQIDECSWMKGSWPVEAQAIGGRHFRGEAIDQNFDVYNVEYTFDDGTKLFMYGRNQGGCNDEFASYAHGTKGMGVVSTAGHSPGKCRTYKGHKVVKKDLTWAFPQPEPNPYQTEWDDLIHAIRNNTPYNEVKRGTEASLVTSMGRKAAHTGQVITYEEMMKDDHEMSPNSDKFTATSAAPVLVGADGKYPVPMPGLRGRREY